MMTHDDLSRMRRLQAGDEQAMSALLAQHWTPVVRYVFGLLGGWDQAEDVALRSYDYHVDLPSGRVFPDGGETLLPILPSFGLTWEF